MFILNTLELSARIEGEEAYSRQSPAQVPAKSLFIAQTAVFDDLRVSNKGRHLPKMDRVILEPLLDEVVSSRTCEISERIGNHEERRAEPRRSNKEKQLNITADVKK